MLILLIKKGDSEGGPIFRVSVFKIRGYEIEMNAHIL